LAAGAKVSPKANPIVSAVNFLTVGHSNSLGLDVYLDPKHHIEARENAGRGQGACRDTSYGDHHCICVEYQSWT
jgi:hypothetical protein